MIDRTGSQLSPVNNSFTPTTEDQRPRKPLTPKQRQYFVSAMSPPRRPLTRRKSTRYGSRKRRYRRMTE